MFALLEFLDSLPEWMTHPLFFVVMGVVFVGLIGLLIFLRTRRTDD